MKKEKVAICHIKCFLAHYSSGMKLRQIRINRALLEKLKKEHYTEVIIYGVALKMNVSVRINKHVQEALDDIRELYPFKIIYDVVSVRGKNVSSALLKYNMVKLKEEYKANGIEVETFMPKNEIKPNSKFHKKKQVKPKELNVIGAHNIPFTIPINLQ